MDSPAYSQNNQHPDSARGGQAILQTHLFTTPMLLQRRKHCFNIGLMSRVSWKVVTVHAVDSVLTKLHLC